MKRDPTIEKQIQQIALSLYGLEPEIHRCHSENSYVCTLDFCGELPDKVIKHARRNTKQVIRDQRILRVLGAAGLPVPDVEFTQDDCEIASSPFFIMPRVTGPSLHDGCWSGAEWVEPALSQAGRFLAHLSTLPPDLLQENPTGQEIVRKQVPLPEPDAWAIANDLDGEEYVAFEQHLHSIDRRLSRRETSLMHGSYSPAHILCDQESKSMITVIDWENAGPGFALRDVGHFMAALQAWIPCKLEYIDWFTAGFQSERLLDEADWAEIRDWEILTYLTWANFFAGQRRREQAAKILNLVRDRFSQAPFRGG